ncbi:flagellar protein FlgA [Knoellia flava TL1]|uniref:Flagellar protein FlgA n=1 Tax=Knoellia flava TL1 TaxID=1385518 RepID=A0ABR4XC91_9MICO|nr:flagellar protein FlgA [Knoellia flava TL1]
MPPRPAFLGPSRRARWRRRVLRRAVAGASVATAALLLVGVVRPPPPATSPVVVAARALEAGALLEPTDLRVDRVPGSSPPPASVARLGPLIGRRVGSAVVAGETLTTTRLVPRSPADGAPRGTVAARLLVADGRSLDLVSAGRRVTVYADTGGPALAHDVLVLGTDTPEPMSFAGSFPGPGDVGAGIVLALEPTELDRVFAGQRPEGGPPRVLTVVTG